MSSDFTLHCCYNGTNKHYLSTKCGPPSKMNGLKQMPGLKKKKKRKKVPNRTNNEDFRFKEFKNAIFSSELFLHAHWTLNTYKSYFLGTNRFEKHRCPSPVYSMCLKLKLTNSPVFKCVNAKNYIPQLHRGNVYKCETELQVNSLWIL